MAHDDGASEGYADVGDDGDVCDGDGDAEDTYMPQQVLSGVGA